MTVSRIELVRALLLSGPYASTDSGEAQSHFAVPAYKTTGLIEIRLEDGTVGIGEGYLAVFAPRVFESLVGLLGPEIVGKDGSDIRARVRDIELASSYWSRDGAARHVVSAFEIALVDARAKQLGVPAYQLLGGARFDRSRSTRAAAMGQRQRRCARKLSAWQSSASASGRYEPEPMR